MSAEAAVQTVPGDPGVASTYLPKQVLRFRASEYLKGTGPTQFTVEVVDEGGIYTDEELYAGYLTEAAARTAATEILASRNTTWDNRPGVLFLKGPLTAASQARASSSQTYGFTYPNAGVYSDFDYAVDTPSRTWLPSNDTPVPGDTGVRGSSGHTDTTEFITDGSDSPAPVMTLSALKTRIAEIDALLVAGDGTQRYRDCVNASLTRERAHREQGGPFPPHERTLGSGLAKGTVLLDYGQSWYDEYVLRTTSGDDADLFAMLNIDDDTDPSNGHYVKEVTTRPLPMGEYTANFHIRPAHYAACGFNPTHNNNYSVNYTVEPPSGTLHEAFFDPVTVGCGCESRRHQRGSQAHVIHHRRDGNGAHEPGMEQRRSCADAGQPRIPERPRT